MEAPSAQVMNSRDAPHGRWIHFDAREWLPSDPGVSIKHMEDNRQS